LPEALPAKAEQSNSSVIYGDKFILKLLRHPYVGINPDLEITEFLTKHEFHHSQQLAAALEFTEPNGQTMTLGMMNRFIRDARDAWAYTLEELGRYYERAARLVVEGRSPPAMGASYPLAQEVPPWAGDMLTGVQLFGAGPQNYSYFSGVLAQRHCYRHGDCAPKNRSKIKNRR
jgi:maltose alpha-D-glucosyltransferase/alpha-amylase